MIRKISGDAKLFFLHDKTLWTSEMKLVYASISTFIFLVIQIIVTNVTNYSTILIYSLFKKRVVIDE